MIEESRFSQVKHLLKLLFPVLVYQMAVFSAQLIDTMMTGQYSEIHLAGVAIASNVWTPFSVFVSGLLSAVTPIVGQLFGSNQRKNISQSVNQVMVLGLVISAFYYLLVYILFIPSLHAMTLEQEVKAIAIDYIKMVAIGIVPVVLYTILRAFVDGLGETKVSMFFMLLLVPFNMTLNYLLIYGKFGFPAMGGKGAGLGTAITYWLVLFVVVLVIKRSEKFRYYRIGFASKVELRYWQEVIKIGFPIGLAYFAETGIFSAVGLLMSTYSAQIIAAHQSAMNFATFMYGFPSSIANTLMIAISQQVGAKEYDKAKTTTWLGVQISITITIFTAIFLFYNRTFIASFYGNTQEFIQLVSSFLLYSILFQVADCVAAPIQGVLRGYKDTAMPMIISLIGYWLIGIPSGLYLMNYTNMGPYGLWIGLIIALIAGGIGLMIRVQIVHRKYAKALFYDKL